MSSLSMITIFVRIFSKTFLHYYSLSKRTWSMVRENLDLILKVCTVKGLQSMEDFTGEDAMER